ncbi:MAG TPA: DNA-3-methyladenine glycosylase [Kofleriaceae bacterium]|nr:DNA-3-methyladenine glycosylase [Kofleriaceae bacterium]
MARPLTRRFYRRSSPELARALLGKRLVHRGRAGVIVETEAYLGPQDGASHARFGVTARNAVMFGEAGFSYVYLCYGVHELFNVVAERPGVGGAVLIRALAPDRGLPDDPRVARGPGKLTRALGIDRSHSAVDLTAGPDLYITDGVRIAAAAVATGPRIGVDYAGPWAREPLRFWVRDHASVS